MTEENNFIIKLYLKYQTDSHTGSFTKLVEASKEPLQTTDMFEKVIEGFYCYHSSRWYRIDPTPEMQLIVLNSLGVCDGRK